VQKNFKEMRNKEATGDNDVPGNVLNLLGEMVSEKNDTTDQQHV
jgi:hypothetical protein